MATNDTIQSAAQPEAERTEEDFPLRKPDWPLGLEMAPHHFQKQDRYHEALIAFALDLAVDRPWGIHDLAIDLDALGAGSFALQRLRGILPDGTPVVVGAGGNAQVAPRSFEAQLRSRATLDIYIGIAPEVPGRGMVDERGDGTAHRFTQQSATVVDYNTGERPIQLPWARPNVELLFQGEPVDKYVVIRIARLQRSGAGRVQLDPKFVPPVLRILASPALEQTIRALESTLIATCAALAEQRPGATGDVVSGEANRLLLSMMLGRLLPRVTGLLGAVDVHPREAYRVLAELVGALSPLLPSGQAEIPPFDYGDLGPTFDGLVTEAHDVLESLAASAYRPIPLRQHEGRWYAELQEPGIFGNEFLVVVSGNDVAALRAHMPRVAKVAAWDEIDRLIGAAVGGVNLVPEPRRPPGLSAPENAICFRVTRRGERWDNIKRNGALGIYLPPGFPYEHVLLFVEERGVLR